MKTLFFSGPATKALPLFEYDALELEQNMLDQPVDLSVSSQHHDGFVAE
jgi:hypothetical protein